MWDYDYFTEHYNTPLDPFSEMLFRASSLAQHTRDYDGRGAWLEMQSWFNQAPNGHYSDRFKKPNHPTFSNESIYHGTDGWYGGQWGRDELGRWTFLPGSTSVYTRQQLQDYLERNDPGVVLQGQF